MNDSSPSDPKTPSTGSPELQGLNPAELLTRGVEPLHRSGGASAWEPPTVEEVGRLLPQYRVERLIGRGGMGAVYQGVQLNLDRPVAIKLLPAEMAADTQFVARFEREARTLAKLQHSRIVTIYDCGRTTEGHLYFVMEYIDGTDLRSMLRGPGLRPDQALVVVGQLCDALQAAHREGIVHRDLKPENVLITRDGYVKLADFGLARPTQEAGTPKLTATNLVLGTPDYMAPEQRSGAATADARSDIFALGVMLYEMLTGQPPRGVFDPPSHKVRVDVRIDEVVLKALQSEPERRYQQAGELKTDVEHIRTTPLPEPVSSPSAAARPRKNVQMAWVVGCAAALFLAAAAALLWRGQKRDFKPAESSVAQVTPRSVVNLPAVTPFGPIPEARKPIHPKKRAGDHHAEIVPPGTLSPPLPPPNDAKVAVAPAPSHASVVALAQVLVGYRWAWARGDEHGGAWRTTVTFHQDGTASNPTNHSTWYWWITDERTVHLQFRPEDGSPPAFNAKVGMDLSFHPDLSGFRGVDVRDPGSPAVEGVRKLPTGEVIAATEVPVARAPAAGSGGPALGQALVANTWAWARGDEHGHTWRTILTFHQDGTVTNPTDHLTWYWWVIDDRTAHLQFHREPGSPGYDNTGMDLAFNAELTTYRGVYLPDPGLPVATGERKAPTGEVIAEAQIPLVRVDAATATERRNFAANLYEALVGNPWEWAVVGETQPPVAVIFKPDGHVSGGWSWHIGYKPDGQAFIDCIWGAKFPHHQYLIFAPSLDAFDSYDMAGKCVVKGRRVGPNWPAAPPTTPVPPRAAPATPAAPASASPTPNPTPAAPVAPVERSATPKPSPTPPARPTDESPTPNPTPAKPVAPADESPSAEPTPAPPATPAKGSPTPVVATSGVANPTATPSPPSVLVIKLDSDPQKSVEAHRGKPVRVSSANATEFRLLPGLKDARLVSLEAVGFPGAYLRHKEAVIWLHERPTTTDLVFEGNASFKLIHLNGDRYRFEASGLPGMFITAKPDGSLILAHDPRPERSTFVLTPTGIARENGSVTQTPVAPISPEMQAATAELVKTYRNSLVMVTGKDSAGSGFLANYGAGSFLFTNAHVAASVKGAAFKTLDGTELKVGSGACAVGHDVFLFEATPKGKPLEVMQGVDENAAIGDPVVVLGNAEGAGVINTIVGKIVGLGPQLVEVDAPFQPGNSGSPIIHLKSGKVIGLATYATIRNYDLTTKKRISDPVVRRFGYRLDSIKAWQQITWPTFSAQAAELEAIETLTGDLSAFAEDLTSNSHPRLGEHDNPDIKTRIETWVAGRARAHTTAEAAVDDKVLLSFLNVICQGDVKSARQHLTYDYFQHELASQQKERDEIQRVFTEIVHDAVFRKGK